MTTAEPFDWRSEYTDSDEAGLPRPKPTRSRRSKHERGREEVLFNRRHTAKPITKRSLYRREIRQLVAGERPSVDLSKVKLTRTQKKLWKVAKPAGTEVLLAPCAAFGVPAATA